MRTQRFITIVCLLLWTVAHLHAYEKRDLLQKEADFESQIRVDNGAEVGAVS